MTEGPQQVTVEMFKDEIEHATQAYSRYVVCLSYPPDQFRESVRRLVARAIQVYQNREPGYRHGFAVNEFVTVILSQGEGDRPLCGIYFNLFSPYVEQLKKKAKDA